MSSRRDDRGARRLPRPLSRLSGCQPPGQPAAPATAAKATRRRRSTGAPKEADLATVTLTPEAETRLGIAPAAVERKPVPRTTTYGGEVMVPSGRLIVVTSPFIGTLKAPQARASRSPGTAVKQGQPIFVLVPILSPESRATMAPLSDRGRGAGQAGDRAAQDRQGQPRPGREPRPRQARRQRRAGRRQGAVRPGPDQPPRRRAAPRDPRQGGHRRRRRATSARRRSRRRPAG